MIKSKSIWLGVAMIGQGLFPLLTTQDIASINWELVQGGLAVIFLRLGIAKGGPG